MPKGNQGPDPRRGPSWSGMERSSKMEFFQKLGYSPEDVVRVLGKMGEGALVNDVLQELIQTGSRPGAHEGSAAPLLIPRGSCATPDSALRRPAAELEEDCGDPASSLRPIVIDGSNVAMRGNHPSGTLPVTLQISLFSRRSHGNKEAFSCRGIQLAVDWFRDRGHTYIKVFVPSWRKDPPRSDTPIRGRLEQREETICEEYADALPSSEHLLAVEGIFFCMPPEAQLRSKSRLARDVGFSSLVVRPPCSSSARLGRGGGEEGVGWERPLSSRTCRGVCEWLSGGGPAPEATASRLPPPLWPPEQHVLEVLEKQAVLVYTPSRKVNGKRVVCYDDRYIVKVAYELDGVIVSNDNYRDLQSENPEWKWFIEQRLLMFSFVNDRFMPPDDPLGRRGPTLSNFLSRKPKAPEPSWQHCPYGKKCTYGIKCKFYHPERPQLAPLAVADELRAQTRAWRAPGARNLPSARPPAHVAALEGSLSRLAFRDDPGLLGPPPPDAGLPPRPCRPDWVAPGASPTPAALRGLRSPQGASGPPVRPRGGHGPGAPHSDLLPQRRRPADARALPPAAGRFPGRSAWAERGWGDGAFAGPAGSPPPAAPGEVDARTRARIALCSIFPPHQVDSVMALFPALSDVTRLILLIQKFQRSDNTALCGWKLEGLLLQGLRYRCVNLASPRLRPDERFSGPLPKTPAGEEVAFQSQKVTLFPLIHF
ncbi:hypothetical protein GH733_000808 [Mirounga leonina]|nr:hypothetical protein GH733_000808 [Mirounga leonina]